MTRLLSYTSAHSAAATRRAGTVPPLALVVRPSSRANLAAAATLLSRCVAVTAVPHPILDAQMVAAGAVVERGTYVLPASAAKTPPPLVLDALAAAHPGSWQTTGKVPIGEVLGDPVMAHLETSGVAPNPRRPKRMSGMRLRVTRSGARLRITPTAEDLVVAGHTIGTGTAGTVLLTPTEAAELIDAARAAGLVVLGAAPDPRLAELTALTDHGCVLRLVPGAPAWAQFHTGPAVKVPAVGPVPVATALELARRVTGDTLVAVDDAVREMDHMIDASTPTKSRMARRDGLRPWQDLFVSTYLASGPGLVNALPPGAGKTVCAAAAMAAHATKAPALYRAVVLAPASLRNQWARELARFFPQAQTRVAETSAELACHLEDWALATDPVVLVLTPQLLARMPETFAGVIPPVIDLVVDEGTYLRNPDSAQGRAAWSLRRRAAHAMVLSGTPDENGMDAVAALVAFARGDADLFTTHPLSRAHPSVAGDRVGPLLFTGPEGVAAQLPKAPPAGVVCQPGTLERRIEAAARERVSTLLSRRRRPSAPQLRTELEAWRLGLTCPQALLRSGYALADDVRAAGPHGAAVAADPTTPDASPASATGSKGVKVEWAHGRVTAATAAGGQVLVFSDFPAALETLAASVRASGVTATVLSSALSTRRRDEAVRAFTDGDLQVLLIAATGQLGLNLQRAATVIHLDVPTSAATLLQRGARAARLGGEHANITVEVPVLAGCADETLLAEIERGDAAADGWSLAHLLSRSPLAEDPHVGAA